ncbi:large conductance mechanosensitive channel protein MscL [Antribacter gilvus]|uniref:large conductance mechanosensitive channel protein MscL n=1 Tax=Antribacter gilvus TaxID=2304675 RepID=UPI000F7AA2E3|nr:large conductance mechanosensitive channel protein MscL [Antribacter gilvus]
MIQGFKDFITRGNVVELAVGIIIGAAFTTVVTGLMNGLLNPLIALIFGQPDISKAGFELPNTQGGMTLFPIGLFLQSILNFLIVAAALYFFVVMPINHLQERRKAGIEPEPEAPAEDVLVLQEIRDLLRAQSMR